MSKTKDIDEIILAQARFLLPFVRANGYPNVQVQTLMDVPWIIVLVFEVLTTEPIADDMKQFETLDQQAHVLQMTLDTIEQTLKIPMNHISGIGLARLKRRHLADALQIFSDLINHCYLTPTKETSEMEGNIRQEVSGLSPIMTWQPEPQGYHHQVRSLACENPEDTHLKEKDESYNNIRRDNQAINVFRDVSLHSSKSSTTLMKEVYRQAENYEKLTRERRCGIRQKVDKVVKPDDYQLLRNYSLFAPRLPSMSLLSPVKSVRKKSYVSVCSNEKEKGGYLTSPEPTKSYRYSPYKSQSRSYDIIEYPLTKRVTEQPRKRISSASQSASVTKKADDKYIKPASSVQRLCRKPSVKSFRSPILSSSVRNRPYIPQDVSSVTSKTNLKTSQNKTNPVKQRDDISALRITTKSGLKSSVRNPKEQQDSIQNRSTKPVPNKYKIHPVKNGNIKKPPGIRARGTSVSVKFGSKGQKSVKKSDTGSFSSRRHIDEINDSFSCGDKEVDDAFSPIEYQRSCTSNRRRRPSVVSTKARKHSLASANSPNYAYNNSSKFNRPIKRGDVSPQTTSLCTSLKLLEEFDYVKRRLKQITIQKREYREAISELEREEVRLEYLLTHVQHQATRALNKGTQGRQSAQDRPV